MSGGALQPSVSCLLVQGPGHWPKSLKDSRAEATDSFPYRPAAGSLPSGCAAVVVRVGMGQPAAQTLS